MPLSRLRPLDVKLLFDDRPYNLGETIDVTVELDSRREVEVREARVDLVCEERYVESYTVHVPAGGSAAAVGEMGGMFGAGGPPHIPRPRVAKEVHKDNKESYIHSSEVFLTNSLLRPGAVDRHNIRLGIEPEPPPHASTATVRWTLEVVVDVARARDFKARHKVDVALSRSSGERV